MIAAKEKITPGQFMILVIQAQIGISVLFLPSSVETIARNDAWICVLLAGLATTVILGVMWKLASRFPAANFLEYLPLLLGKIPGKIAHLCFICMFILNSGQIMVLFADVTRDWIFSETPRWVILGLMLATAGYLARENVRTIARFCVMTFGLVFVLIFIAAYAFKNAELLYILPMARSGLPNLAHGTLKASYSLYGFELVLFCFPYVQGSRKDVLKALFSANTFSTAMYTFLVFICLVVFSPEELKIIPQPVLYMVKALSLTIIERADLYFLSFWAIIIFSTVAIYLYMSAKSVSTLFGKKGHRGTIPIVALLILVIAEFPHNQDAINRLQNIVYVFAGVSFVFLPLLMLFLSYVRGIKGKEQTDA
ncbi:GerAB/ArcD/ProY family transporter [Cohnella soli]|uniref:GerAB/ArcD/ProY family transporter n=1 Tax=Cohnella soli TaxID=425005 RepID=A0ABW0HSA5_9BACL